MSGFRFAPPRRRMRAENVVPMINVVFLLLIFFLISAQIAPAPPFDLRQAEAEDGARQTLHNQTLWIDASGALAYQNARGEAVWALLQEPLQIQADADVPARDVARVLTRLGQVGIADVTLITQPKGSR